MSDNEIARFLYLALLLIVIGGYALLAQRRNFNKALRNALLWGLIFIGLIGAKELWDDFRLQIPHQSVEGAGQNILIASKQPDGHFYLTLDINNTPVRFLVDTGASQIVLSKADAERLGFKVSNLAFWGDAFTANGGVKTALVKLDKVTVGAIEDRKVMALVNQGEMEQSLLGMSYLGLFSSVEIQKEKLILTR